MIVERFNGRLPGYIGYGNDKFSFSHVDNVVDAHIAALDKGQPGQRYLFTGENASFLQVFDMAAAITNTKTPRFNIPMLVMEIYGWLSVLFARITGKLPLISPPVLPFSCLFYDIPRLRCAHIIYISFCFILDL
ncbi:putative farnesol dehydrogenase (NAD(+)) [Helianthus debilis subsp. tardiflorus]